MEAITIRELQADDLEAFYQLRLHGLEHHSRSFWEAADEFIAKPMETHLQRLQETASAPDKFVLGAFIDDQLVGMVGFYREQGKKGYHRGSIWGMYVHTDHQGNGIGGQLLDAAIDRAKAIEGMEVLFLFATQTEPAIRLYESRGFRTYGIEPFSLKDNGVLYDEAMMYLKL